MTGGARLRLGLIVVTILVVQLTLLDGVSVYHIHPDALVLVAAAGGLVAGPQRGATVGFVAGLASDLFLATPFGLSALAFTLVGFGVGMARASLILPTWWLTPAAGALASAAGVVIYALLGATVGQSQMLGDRLALVVGVVALANAVLAPLVVSLVRWALDSGAAGERSLGSPTGSSSRAAALSSSAGRLAPGTIRGHQ
ncbi:MAG: rod shape-determining protein MreD [Acidimicrobiales bacterium]|nr:MAG: rod shape-determining protein MreD [Acidimicrobiales bacterium]